MSLPQTTQRMTRPMLAIAVAVVALAFSLWGSERGVAALIGASLSVGNWFALRWLASRLVASSGSSAVLSMLLIAKIGLLMAIVFVLINRLSIDALGLAFGLGVLFVGPVLAALASTSTGTAQVGGPESPLHSPAVRSAREER